MQRDHHNWQTKYKKKLISLGILTVLSISITWYLSGCTCHAGWYNEYVFQPLQFIRNTFLRHIPFSIGDIMYVCWSISLLILIIKWVYYLIQLHEYRNKFIYSFLKSINSLLGLYLFFMIGWGGNYYKEPLGDYWALETKGWNDSALIAFDSYLVKQLNTTAPHYHENSFLAVRNKAEQYYRLETDCLNNAKGLHVKPAIFGNMLQYMGVQGYFNPFTGEGQVNRNELHFMLPYVISHELAHQSGVGAEDDANLLAYTVSVNTNDSSFMYSAYFNLWLYTHIQLRMRDTVAANTIKKSLNAISLAHLQALRTQRRKYRSKFSGYTGNVYDQYLKFNHQKDGIESYDKVTVSAWAWENKRRNLKESKIYIP